MLSWHIFILYLKSLQILEDFFSLLDRTLGSLCTNRMQQCPRTVCITVQPAPSARSTRSLPGRSTGVSKVFKVPSINHTEPSSLDMIWKKASKAIRKESLSPCVSCCYLRPCYESHASHFRKHWSSRYRWRQREKETCPRLHSTSEKETRMGQSHPYSSYFPGTLIFPFKAFQRLPATPGDVGPPFYLWQPLPFHLLGLGSPSHPPHLHCTPSTSCFGLCKCKLI